MDRKVFRERIVYIFLLSAALVTISTTLLILSIFAFETISFFMEVSLYDFFTDTQWTPLFTEKHFGILPLLSGSLLIAVVSLAVSIPVGLVVSVFMSEFLGPNSRIYLKPVLEVLAGIPSVVYGFAALLYLTPFLQGFSDKVQSFNALSPGIMIGVMILPTVISLSYDTFQSIPKDMKLSAYALGARRLQMIVYILLPASVSGIVSSFILGFSRAVGETMIVAIAAGQNPSLGFSPLEPIQTLTGYILQISMGDVPSGTIEYKTIFAVGMMLFLLACIFNTVSMKLRNHSI